MTDVTTPSSTAITSTEFPFASMSPCPLTREVRGDLPEGLVDLVAVLGRHQEGRHVVLLRELRVCVQAHGGHVLKVICGVEKCEVEWSGVE